VHYLRVSSEAENDLDLIVEYTIRTWGTNQADEYLARIEDGLNLLAKNPAVGRACEAFPPGLHRFELEKHVVFYLCEPDGILVVRILHQSMVPDRYL
jgi:toxin ParE1/3/4